MARNKVQDALRQRKRSEAEAAMANGPPEEGAYDETQIHLGWACHRSPRTGPGALERLVV